MSTEYQQVPSQQAFFSAQTTDLDPWLISATSNLSITWGKGAKREYVSPPLYDDDMRWSPPSTPTYKLTKKPFPSQYLSTLSSEDPWAVVHEVDQDDTQSVDSHQDDDASQNLYKTELCRSFEENGTCRYGTKCQFAHGRPELRSVLRHPKYKTEICKTFHTLGTCPYGTRCRFIHTKPKAGGHHASSQSVPTSPTYHSPSYASPYTSPPNRISKTRPSSPASVVPSTPISKWSTNWPTPKKFSLDDDGEVPDVQQDAPAQVPVLKAQPQSPVQVPVQAQSPTPAPAPSAENVSPSSTPKKRLAIFRTIVD